MSESIIAGCCFSITLILFSAFILIFIPHFADEQMDKWRLPLPNVGLDRYEWCIVVDEDTVRFGGNEFKRVRTCHDTHESEWSSIFTCSNCGNMFETENDGRSNTFNDEIGIHHKYCPNCGAKVVE